VGAVVVLLGPTSDVSKTGPAINVSTVKRDKDALYTATISVDDFCGRIYLQGTLVKNPKANDWFNIKIGDNRFIDYPLTPGAPRTGTLGDTATDKFNFAGNYLQLRAVIDKEGVPTPSGSVLQILLSDEYSSGLHNDQIATPVTPVPGPVGPGPGPSPAPPGPIPVGEVTAEYATVTVNPLGKVTKLSSGDPTKISAQTNVFNTYAELVALTPPPQVGDAAFIMSLADPQRGYYVYTGAVWHGLTDNDFAIKRNVAAGTYTNATVQLDSFGRVISASAGTDVNSLTRSIAFTALSSELAIGEALPANCRVTKIVVAVQNAFDPLCQLNVTDGTSTLITSDEIMFEDSNETSIFEINKHYGTSNVFKIMVNNNGTQAGSGTIIIDFALD